MRFVKNIKQPTRKLKAVVLFSGNLVIKATSGPDKFFDTSKQTISPSIYNIEHWGKQPNSTPVYEGDTVTLEF